MRVKQNYIYFLISISALILCWCYNLEHINQGGDLESFITDNLINPASASIFYDISFLFLSICLWFYFEGKKHNIQYWWVYIVIGLVVGISFSFPLFLIHKSYKQKN